MHSTKTKPKAAGEIIFYTKIILYIIRHFHWQDNFVYNRILEKNPEILTGSKFGILENEYFIAQASLSNWTLLPPGWGIITTVIGTGFVTAIR